VCPSAAKQSPNDTEIASDKEQERPRNDMRLEGKLSKARAVKAGMMSELLMGKIRLNRD
jgi:hypothetical protein